MALKNSSPHSIIVPTPQKQHTRHRFTPSRKKVNEEQMTLYYSWILGLRDIFRRLLGSHAILLVSY